MHRGISLNNTITLKTKKSRPPPVRTKTKKTRPSHPNVSLNNVSHPNSSHPNVSLDPMPKVRRRTRRHRSHNNVTAREEIARRVEERRLETSLETPNKIDKKTKTTSIKERKMANQVSDKKMLEGVINFFSGKKEFRSLSNFWENDVIVDGSVYESGEHAFHGEKYTRLGEICEDEDREKELLEYGQTFMKPSPYKTGAMVKKMGGKTGLLLTPHELKLWSTISIDVQTKICKYKFDTYEEVRQDLLKSDGKLLVHPAMRCSEAKLESTCVWEGKGVIRDGKLVILGKNLLGNIWMSFR